MILSLKRQLEFWKIVALALPFVAVLLLLLIDFIEPSLHDKIYCIALISVITMSVAFWIWTVVNMVSLVYYISTVDKKYIDVIQELKETKELLRQEGQDARNRKR